MRILFLLTISFLILLGSQLSMSNSTIIRRVTYYSELENIRQIEVISAAMRIIGKETTFSQEKKNLGEFKLFYPKNPSHPVLIAYSYIKISGMEFARRGEKEDWSSVEIYPSGGQRNVFQIHLPDFKDEYFKKLNLEFEKKYAEKIIPPNHLNENNDTASVAHIFDYNYQSKNGIELSVQFRVLDKQYKIGDKYPRYFDFVRISRK